MKQLAKILLMIFPIYSQAASFDCMEAGTKAEHLICDNQKLSELDNNLDKVYQEVLRKSNEEQKSLIIIEQNHWLAFTRNACEKESCLRHAYWSRQAALDNYFEPHFSPLYPHESDKAEAIKQVLATATLYSSHDTSFCNQIFDDLKQMKNVRLVDPIVQTQSYEDPALDSWKKQCQSAPPFNFGYWCDRNIVPANADDLLDACEIGYGLPPFKLYELPSADSSDEKRYFFYSDDGYGPMNRSWTKPLLGSSGPVGFQQIHLAKCVSAEGNRWEKDGKLSSWHGVSIDAGQGGRNGKNYNSIIEYKKQYYFLILHEVRNNYWLEIEQTTRTIPPTVCDWSPVKG